MYAEIVLANATKRTNKIYHYSIPSNLKVEIGSQVLIPFGHRKDIGYIIGLVEKTEVKGIKDIISVTSSESLFGQKQIELAKWLSDYYCSFFVAALKLVMPPEQKIRNPKPEILSKSEILQPKPEMKLTDEQQRALDSIVRSIEKKEKEAFLLHGITGSGKTEVYMRSIGHLLSGGREAIVLVPEISLTPQLVERFRARFGDLIAVLHSGLTLKQRGIEWARVKSGEAKVVLGTRSAIFAPVKNLGMIVIDEEYETSYKQDKNPRYHVREVADKLAELHQAIVVMGSATPSIETFFQAQAGKVQKLTLPERIDNRPLPPVDIIDMREDKKFLLSAKLREELAQTLSRGEQAILFINRRGYFTFVMCRECGFSIECPKCTVSLSYHSEDRKLRCNRCGFSTEAPIICPRCHSSSIKYFGTGTQRIEKEVGDTCPSARILRWDRDTVSKRGSHEVFFSAFAEGKADVLIGTQMVAKGLDVANVTLIGVVSADTALHLPDFRAAEYTFQLLTQVAGRAGRHHLPGKVIIQTYMPEHYAIQSAAKHDYEGFYKQELEKRKELEYPPFSKIISLLVSGEDEGKVKKVIQDIVDFLRKRISQGILGPAPAVIPKLRGNFRYHILMKGNAIREMRNAICEVMEKIVVPTEIRVAIDVDPMGMV